MAKYSIPVVIVLLLIGFLYFSFVKPTGKRINQLNQPSDSPSKPVVMIVIDSLMDVPIQSVIKNSKAPALKFLIDNGDYYQQMVTSYPTMSVSIDSTLITGTYPDLHKVPALVWYDELERRLISYGSAKKEVLKLGPRKVFKDSVFHLNHHHLSPHVKTIHEDIDGQSASINTLVYRGSHKHSLKIPKLLSSLRVVDKNESIKGPNYFSFGMLSQIDPENKNNQLWQGFGFNDKFATQELCYLIKQNRLPAFSLVYLSDNDKQVHKNGENETKGIEDADKQLQEILNNYDSWEEAIKKNVWIVMGDSGQTDVGMNKQKALIDLRDLFKDYKIHKIDGPVLEQDQIVLGLNERMSFIYLLDENLEMEKITTLLSKDDRINLIAWNNGEIINVVSGNKPGRLSFKPTGKYIDQYEQTWSLEGNINLLDLKIKNNTEIMYNDYPDGLARLNSSFYSHLGNYIVVDAKPGYEFVGEGSPTHVGGGSHGSLHKQDALFPMIVTGTEQIPKHLRIVDLKEWVFKIIEQN